MNFISNRCDEKNNELKPSLPSFWNVYEFKSQASETRQLTGPAELSASLSPNSLPEQGMHSGTELLARAVSKHQGEFCALGEFSRMIFPELFLPVVPYAIRF